MKRSSLWKSIRKDKAALREKTAARSFGDKLRIVERIRDRDAVIRGAKGHPGTRGDARKK